MVDAKAAMVVRRGLWIYTLILVSLTSLAWGVYLLEGKPEMQRPLFNLMDRYHDLTNYRDKVAHLAEGGAAMGTGMPVYNYPAPAAYLYVFFLRGFPHHSVRAYLITLGAELLVGATLLWRATRSGDARTDTSLAAAIISTAVLGSPMVFSADRGNLEGIVAFVLGVGLVLFVKRHYYLSATFIGLAASLKPLPGIFLFLLFARRRYREAAVGIVVALSTVLLALIALGPTPLKAYIGLRPGVETYYNGYLRHLLLPYEARFLHSVTDTLKALAGLWASQPFPEMDSVLLAGSFIGLLGLAFVVIRGFSMPTLNQMIMLGAAVTLFAPSASEYTLLSLYVPFGIFLIFLTKSIATSQVVLHPQKLFCLLILFALLFSPLTFLGQWAGVSKTALLVCLLLASSSWRMPASFLDPGCSGHQSNPLSGPS